MKVIIFDMDGVLIDSEPIYLSRVKEFLKYKKFDINEDILLETIGGNSKRDFELYKNNIKNFYSSIDGFHEEYQNFFKNKPVNYKTILNKNVVEIMKFLKQNGFNISIASSSRKELINEIIDLIGIREYLDFIVSGEDFKESKPNPEIYLHVVNLYNTQADYTFAVEDSQVGIEAAKNAGLKVICKNDSRFNFDQSKADYWIDDLIEIKQIVMSC